MIGTNSGASGLRGTNSGALGFKLFKIFLATGTNAGASGFNSLLTSFYNKNV